jgi:RimJ/RimL family protein N-acetyltransferase
MAMVPTPVTLTGTHVRLEPLGLRHADDLYVAGDDPRIWRYLPRPQPTSVAETRAWIEQALQIAAGGTQVPFAIVDVGSDRAVGTTRYLEIRGPDRGLEIGSTWLSTASQRTAINTEAKYLLLSHAFDTLGALRVQFKTDRRNEKSQKAIERLGAVREGILRKQMVMSDGHIRDSVYYSITDDEWPSVRARLEVWLRRDATAAPPRTR